MPQFGCSSRPLSTGIVQYSTIVHFKMIINVQIYSFHTGSHAVCVTRHASRSKTSKTLTALVSCNGITALVNPEFPSKSGGPPPPSKQKCILVLILLFNTRSKQTNKQTSIKVDLKSLRYLFGCWLGFFGGEDYFTTSIVDRIEFGYLV